MITPDHIPDVNERLKASHYMGIPCTVSPEEYWAITLPTEQQAIDKRPPRAAHYHCIKCPVNIDRVCDLPCDQSAISLSYLPAVIKVDFDTAQRKQDEIDEWLKA